MSDTQHQRVTSQFAGTAQSYANSPTHNDPEVIQDLIGLIRPQAYESVLDIASGPGTVALALAPFVSRAVALDLTPSMMELAAKRAKEAGFAHFETFVSPAESLPFDDDTFDIVTVRTAPHHFADVQASVREMARVVKPTGRVLIVDTCSPEDEELAKEMNAIEAIRDPSHVWNYAPSQWRSFLSAAGLEIDFERVHSHALGKKLDFDQWVERMRVPASVASALRERFLAAPAELRKILQVEESNGALSFTLPEITILAHPGR